MGPLHARNCIVAILTCLVVYSRTRRTSKSQGQARCGQNTMAPPADRLVYIEETIPGLQSLDSTGPCWWAILRSQRLQRLESKSIPSRFHDFGSLALPKQTSLATKMCKILPVQDSAQENAKPKFQIGCAQAHYFHSILCSVAGVADGK